VTPAPPPQTPPVQAAPVAAPVGTPAPAPWPADTPIPMPPLAAPRRARWPWVALALAIVVGGAAVAVVATRGGDSDHQETSTSELEITPTRAIYGEAAGEPTPAAPEPPATIEPTRKIFADYDRAGDDLAAGLQQLGDLYALDELQGLADQLAGLDPGQLAGLGGGPWTHPAFGYTLDVPAGFMADPSVPGTVSFAGLHRGAPAVISISGEHTDTRGVDDSTLRLAADSVAAAAAGVMVKKEFRRVQGKRRMTGIYDLPLYQMRVEFVIFVQRGLVLVAAVGVPRASFDGSAAFRRELFGERLRLP
jgi:hypothetical protein